MTSVTKISSAFYRFLCQHVVGTEETVNARRMLNTVNDAFFRHPFFTIITSGSLGEGLEIKGSDLDIMGVLKHINIYEHIGTKYDPENLSFIMDTEGTKLGFTKLKLIGYEHFKYKNKVIEDLHLRGDFYFSNILCKNLFLFGCKYKDKLIIHGPCLSDKEGIYDFAAAVQSKTWIIPASHWLYRAHNEWPCHDVKQKIVDYGVLFVPIGVKGSDNEELEWRISFSVGEKLLVYTFNHTQVLCYALMKILLKDIIERDSKCKSVLCSYYIKTIIFWVFEEEPLSVWRPENLIPCFLKCFQRLIYCVEYSVCPHYFIPDINMFETRIEGVVRRVLLENLNVLYSDGWRCLLTSQQLSMFERTPLRTEFNSFQCSINALINSKALYLIFLESSCAKCINRGRYGITHFLQYRSHNIKSYYVYGLSSHSSCVAQSMKVTEQKGNKDTYKRYNTCLSYLLLNTNHDAISGWLMLASLFYKMKLYRLALNVLLYSLSKHSAENIQRGENLMCHCWRHTIVKQMLSHETWKSLGILRTIKTICFEPALFTLNSQLIPDELLPNKLEYGKIFAIHPVVFAHFLCFLCHFHLGDVRQYHSSLRDLRLTITEKYFGLSAYDKCIAYFLLGIAANVTGDNDSARDAIMRGVKICTNNISFISPFLKIFRGNIYGTSCT